MSPLRCAQMVMLSTITLGPRVLISFQPPLLCLLWKARPWARSGDGEIIKTNPCLQGAYSLVGKETCEQDKVVRARLGTQGRALVQPPELALAAVIDGSFCLPHPSPNPQQQEQTEVPMGEVRTRDLARGGEEMKQNRDNCSQLTTFSN